MRFGGVNDQWNTSTIFKERARLGPLALFAQLIAVVGNKDNGRGLAQTQVVEFGDDSAKVPVGPGDGSQISADHFLRLGCRGAATYKKVGVAHSNGGLGKASRNRWPGGKIGRQEDLPGIVQVEEALGRGGRAVWLGETATDEEGFVFARPEILNGKISNQIVACPFSVAIEDENLIGVCGLLAILRQYGKKAIGRRYLRTWNLHALSGCDGVEGLDSPVEVGPRLVIIEICVKELAAAQGGVAMFAEELRKSGPVRMQIAQAGTVAENPRRMRRVAAQERRARWVAEGKLAVVAIEANPLFGERVDVGTMCVEATSIAGEFGTHVVRHEEEYVERPLAGMDRCGFLRWQSYSLSPGRKCGRDCDSGCLSQKASTRGIGRVLIAHNE